MGHRAIGDGAMGMGYGAMGNSVGQWGMGQVGSLSRTVTVS